MHEIEIGDLDRDGKLEVYATPSEPNRLDAGATQSGHVVRYVPAAGKEREVVADLGERHAKEILVADVDGDGTDELYVSVEGDVDDAKRARAPGRDPPLRRRHAADRRRRDRDARRPPDPLPHRGRRGRRRQEGAGGGGVQQRPVAAAARAPTRRRRWQVESIDTDSAGFEHASILSDLDGDGTDELYVASDKHKQVRRYVWDGRKLAREIIYRAPGRPPHLYMEPDARSRGN